MKTIRLSGTIIGEEDPNREIRAKMLYGLFTSGWDIYNSNGDQQITLSNIEQKIIETNAFMFMPGATLDDLFKAVSIFVGYQTLDAHLHDKPTVILNSDGSWNPLFELLDALQSLGTIHQNYRKFLLEAQSVDEALHFLNKAANQGLPDSGRIHADPTNLDSSNASTVTSFGHNSQPQNIQHNVCVFCSASIKHTSYLDEGYQLGQQLAEQQLGCVSGAGKSGVMGKVVAGCIDTGGWAAGSNVPHIIELEGLPKGLSEFWLREDIYTRMEIMIEKSHAFIIFPGGAGTLQEMLALLIFKKIHHPLMQNKPIIIYNKRTTQNPQDTSGFWDALLPMLTPYAEADTYIVVDNFEELMPTIQESLGESGVKNKRAG
jgi:uncharacterized protein (TIGR00730 family)